MRWTAAVLYPIFGRHGRPFRVLLLFSFVLLLHSAVVDVFTGNGPSMLPTFALSGELFLVEAVSSQVLRLSHTPPDSSSLSHLSVPSSSPSFASLVLPVLRVFFSIEAGDVVLCSNPVKAEHSIAKRVIALPGEAVRSRVEDAASVLVVPEGCVWLQGDCLDASRDSREYGPVPIDLIKGKVFAKVWPLHAARRIERTLRYRGY
jgi:signal peptidase I